MYTRTRPVYTLRSLIYINIYLLFRHKKRGIGINYSHTPFFSQLSFFQSAFVFSVSFRFFAGLFSFGNEFSGVSSDLGYVVWVRPYLSLFHPLIFKSASVHSLPCCTGVVVVVFSCHPRPLSCQAVEATRPTHREGVFLH